MDEPDVPGPAVAVIGGSGFYTFLDGTDGPEGADGPPPREVTIDTPYGPTSSPITVGAVGGVPVAFLPRHGGHHEFPAHRVPYRANLWALRSLGVRQVLAPCAVGGLQPELGPGTLVVPDQLVDRTTSRVQTYYDTGACHVGFADPYCPRLRDALLDGVGGQDGLSTPVDGGVMVVIEGPRFSTRAESRWYAAQDWSVVNMTGHPEAVLARELALCYATVALVTDHDAGVDAAESVTQEAVFAMFASHTASLQAALRTVVAGVGTDRDCPCPHALDGLDLP